MEEDQDTKERDRRTARFAIGFVIILALIVAAIGIYKYYPATPTAAPKPPPPKCEVLVIDGAILETFGMHLLAIETQEGQPLYSLVRCHNAPENLPIHMTFQQVGGQALQADFLLERLSGTDPWELIGVGTPPAGEYKVHVSVEGQEVAWTWFRVVGAEPNP